MKKQHLVRVLSLSILVLSVIFFIFQDLAIIFSIIIFVYEFIIGNILIILNCSFNLLKYSIPYLFIFFVLCLFNVRYIGYIKFKFFGIDLQQQNSKITYLAFFFKEYNYWILFVVNFFLIMLFLYNIMYKNFLISGLILSFYIFIGLSVYIKRWLIKNNYYNKKTFNMSINIILVAIYSLYLTEAGDALEQYLGYKINLGEFLYGFFKQKDKILLNLRHDNMWNNYKWWHLQDLYKNQKASWNYLYLKNKIINQKLLTDVEHNNKIKKNYQIQQNNINIININNNNIYTDKNIGYYTNKKLEFNNQVDLLKKLEYYKCLENKKLKLYLWNIKGFSAGDFVPKGIRTNFNLLFLLDKDKGSVINYLNKVLLDKKIAKALNSYLYLQNKYNNQQNYFNILLNKKISSTTKSLLFFKFTKKSVLNIIKEQDLFKNNKLKLDLSYKNYIFDNLQKYIKYIANAFNHNFIYKNLYSYNHFLNWWEKQHYIINNFFKGYNIKKYAPLTKYNFQGKNTLYNLFKKDSADTILKPMKTSKIHEIKFKFKLSNYIDRNLLYFKYSKNNKIVLLNNLSKLLLNNDMFKKNVDDKLMFIVKQNIIYKQPTFVETFLHNIVNWSKFTILKSIYLKYYPPQIPELYHFRLKNSYSALVIYSENYNNKYYTTWHSKIEALNIIEYQKIYRSFSIYSYFFNKYMNFDFNDKINNLEGKINHTKKIYSIFFKDNTNNYNNKSVFSLFKYTYVWRLNDYLDISTYKNYIIKIASNLDTDDNIANKYFQQFLFKTSDILACYFSINKMSFGMLIDYLKQWQLFFNKYAKFESTMLKRKEDYNFFFKTLKNPYLDRSSFINVKNKDFIEYSCPEERIVAENLALIDNHINICNLAYDTQTAMLQEDLNAFINEKESILLLKGEVKSCNVAAECLMDVLQDLYTKQNNCLDLIQLIYKGLWVDVKDSVTDVYKEIEDIEQLKRVFSNFTEEEIKAFIKTEEDRNSIEYALNFDEEMSDLVKYDINIQYEICVAYIKKWKALEMLAILDKFNCSLEELLENIIKMRETDQENLTYSIENKLKSLKEFALKRNQWLEEPHKQHISKLKKETELLTQKKWDLYNYNRFKNEIITFKNKK